MNLIQELRQRRVPHLQGQSAEAVAMLQEALQLDPAHPHAHLEMAQVLHQQGQIEQAREHLRTTQAAWTEAHPDFPLAQQAHQLAAAIQ